ncbi:MAG: NPCBM/NEW2 domain-containing protein [Terriglobia bacterium]
MAARFSTAASCTADGARSFSVSVEGVKELKIEALDAGDGDKWDHADWADPVLVGDFAEGQVERREGGISRQWTRAGN